MRRITAWCLSAALLLGGLSGCGTARQSTAQTQAAVSWSDMQPTDSVDLEYAECFSVDHYDGGYSLITVKDDARYLVVPENASVPDGLDADIVVLQQLLDSIYLVSSSVMDQFVALDALDSIAPVSYTHLPPWMLLYLQSLSFRFPIPYFSSPIISLFDQTGSCIITYLYLFLRK